MGKKPIGKTGIPVSVYYDLMTPFGDGSFEVLQGVFTNPGLESSKKKSPSQYCTFKGLRFLSEGLGNWFESVSRKGEKNQVSAFTVSELIGSRSVRRIDLIDPFPMAMSFVPPRAGASSVEPIWDVQVGYSHFKIDTISELARPRPKSR